MKTIIYTFLLLSVLLNLSSCKTRYVKVPIETIKKEKEYIDRWDRDSIFVKDSVFFAVKGDTVYKEKYKYIYKDKLIRDSIFITDSIQVEVPYPVVEIKEINRLNTWQIVLMCLGGVFIGWYGYRLFSQFKP